MNDGKYKIAAEDELPPPPPAEYKLASDDEIPPPPPAEFRLSSPKQNAPSANGGGNGAQNTPSSSSSSELSSWTTEANPLASKPQVQVPLAKPIDGVEQTKIVQPRKAGGFQPLVQDGIQKIEGMTMGVKYPEYSNPSTNKTFDFKQASKDVISEKQQAEKQESLNRKEQRRIEKLPSEIESLRNERADLLLDKSPDAKRKLAANEAVTEKMQSDLDNISKSKYESLQNLNQKAVKGVELEVNEYLDENPKLRDEIKVKGLTDTETYNLVQQSVAKKIAPLEADLQIFQQEGTVDAAKDKIKISNELHARQEKIEGLASQLKTYQDDYLNKAGFSDLNNQLNTSIQSLKKYEPVLNKAKAEVSGYEKELTQIQSKLDTYKSKIQGNSFNGTEQELNEYRALEKDYNETISDLNNVYKNESLKGYEEAVANYNSLAAKRNSIVKGLNNNEYNTIKGQYDAKVAEYDLALNDYNKFEEPEIKDRINKYFSTIQKIGEYDQKVKTTRGELAYVEDLQKAKEKFNKAGFGSDVLDIGGAAVNSILDAAKKLVASPFRIAGSMSDVYGSGSDVYHYSDFVADLIEGKGSEGLFLTKDKNVFYDSVTDKINWGVIPVLRSVADQSGILLTLALTGKFATPTVTRAMTVSGADLTTAAEIAESAKIATTIAPAFMISYGDNYKEALDKGFSGEGAIAYSGALSLLEGLTETILPDQDLLFGKEAKGVMLNRFIKDYAKGKKFAIKNMTNDFLFNALGESTEEGIAALGKTLATSIGHLVDNDIDVEIPTMNQNITTYITAGLSGGGAGLVGSISENSQIYKMGVMQLANDFETGKALLSKLNEKGKIDNKRYNKLISDVQKFQSVKGQIPQGLSNFKTMAIAEKMIAIKDLSAEMDEDKLNPFNKINAKKITAIQDEIEQIIDDKNFDARSEYELNLEAEELGKTQEEKQETEVTTKPILQVNTSPTNEKYGTVNRNDGKGIVDLTKEEYLKEQGLATPEAEAGVTLNTETDGKERRKEEAENVLTSETETKGVVEAAPLITPNLPIIDISTPNPFNKYLEKLGYQQSDIDKMTMEQKQEIVINKTQAPVVESSAKVDSTKENAKQEKIAAAQEQLDQEIKAENESNIQQQVDKGDSNDGAVGDIAKVKLTKTEKGVAEANGQKAEDVLPTRAIFKNKINQEVSDWFGNTDESDIEEGANDVRTETVSVNDITPTQIIVDKNAVGSRKDKSLLPVLVKTEKGLFVLDGHHRIAAEILSGNANVEAKIIDLTDGWVESVGDIAKDNEAVDNPIKPIENETKNTAITADAGKVEPTNMDSEVAKDDTKGEVSEINPKDKVWLKAKAYNNLSKTERKSTYGSKLRSEIMAEAAALNYTVKPTKQGKYILVDEKGKEIRNVGTPRSKDVIQEEKRIKERRSRARRELPISVKHSVAQDIANGVQFDRESLMKVSGLRDNEIPFWMTRTDGKGETLEFYSQKYQEKGGAFVEDDMDFQSQVADAIGEFAHKQGRTSALEYIETIQEKLENGGLTDAEMKEQAAEYQAELDEANFDYYAEYLSGLSNEEAQELADQLRESEKQENKLIINEILNENGKENNREAGQGKQKVDIKTPNVEGKSETITALEKELSDIDNQIAKKQSQLNKLTKDQQSDMFGGAKVEMFDNSELLKELTNDIKDLKQKRNEKSAELEKQLEKESIVIQPENQLDIEKEAAKVKGEKELNKPKSAKEVAKEKLDQAREAFRKAQGKMQSGGLAALPEFINLVKAAVEYGIVSAKEFVKEFRGDIAEKYSDKEVEKAFEDVRSASVKLRKTQELRDELGIPKYQKSSKKVATLEQQAQAELDKGYDINKLIAKLEAGILPSDVEQVIMTKYLAGISDKIEKNPTDELIAQAKRAIEASDKIGGTEVARSLAARRNVEKRNESLMDYFIEEMEASETETLTETQKGVAQKEYEEIKAAKEALEKKIAELEAAANKKKAERKISSEPKAKKKTHDEYVSERKAIVTDIKKKLRQLRGETNAVIIPYAKELVAIAPDVAKMVKSYVSEGISNIDDIVKNIHTILKEDIPEITEKDVLSIIAGNYNEPKFTRTEAQKKAFELKQQAKLILKLENILAGEEPKNEVKKRIRNKEIEALKKQIKEQDLSKLATYKANVTRQIDKIEADLASGNVLTPEPKEPLKLDAEAIRLKDKYIKAKQERELRILKEKYANRSKYQKLKDEVIRYANVPRTIMSSMDFSAPLRQALVATTAHPVLAARAFKEMFQQAFSQKRFDRWFYDVRQDYRWAEANEAGLFIADPHDVRLNAAEEAFMGNIAEKIPLVGQLIKGSERAYVSYLNKMRWDLYNQMSEAAQDNGMTIYNSPEVFKGIASFVNNATGRGKFSGMAEGLETAAPILNAAFFSPRLVASRLNFLNPLYYAKLPKEVRIQALKDMAKFIAVGLSVLALASLGGDDDEIVVEKDPRSTDFGKIRFGNTRWDIWGGYQQYVRFLTQFITGQTKSSMTGELSDLTGQGKFGRTRGDITLAFVRGKLAPIPALAVDVMAGRTVVGEPVTIQGELKSHLAPLIFSDVSEVYKDKGIAGLLQAGIPATFGVGVSSYKNKHDKYVVGEEETKVSANARSVTEKLKEIQKAETEKEKKEEMEYQQKIDKQLYITEKEKALREVTNKTRDDVSIIITELEKLPPLKRKETLKRWAKLKVAPTEIEDKITISETGEISISKSKLKALETK